MPFFPIGYTTTMHVKGFTSAVMPRANWIALPSLVILCIKVTWLHAYLNSICSHTKMVENGVNLNCINLSSLTLQTFQFKILLVICLMAYNASGTIIYDFSCCPWWFCPRMLFALLKLVFLSSKWSSTECTWLSLIRLPKSALLKRQQQLKARVIYIVL